MEIEFDNSKTHFTCNRFTIDGSNKEQDPLKVTPGIWFLTIQDSMVIRITKKKEIDVGVITIKQLDIELLSKVTLSDPSLFVKNINNSIEQVLEINKEVLKRNL